jgi:hypothetical protein
MRTRFWQSDSQYYRQYTGVLKIDTEMDVGPLQNSALIS